MNKIEKIKTEIEFRIAQWQQYTFACASQIASEAIDRIDELKGLLAFIDSLQNEPKKLKAGKGSYKWLKEQQQFEDIKAELNKLLTECEVDLEAEYVYRSMLLLVARHFTEWQKGKDCKISEDFNQNFTKSFDDMDDYDTEVWNWLKEHGTEENKQVIMMTARHFYEYGKKCQNSLHIEKTCKENDETFTYSEDLEKAAEKYSENVLAGGEDMFDAIADGFIAGAEWMAGQGVSMQITDDTEWEEVDSFIHKNVDGCSIIQIRKK